MKRISYGVSEERPSNRPGNYTGVTDYERKSKDSGGKFMMLAMLYVRIKAGGRERHKQQGA